MNKKYFDYAQNDTKTTINIYGDISDNHYWGDEDVTPKSITDILETATGDVDVYINSYGGSVSAGWAIANALRRYEKGKVTTFIDGFACSSAATIFMAGAERIMNNISLLMIHNSSTFSVGNSKQLHKTAEDLSKIDDAIKQFYLNKINISEDELTELMDNESWISSEDALNWNFATKIENNEDNSTINNSAMQVIYNSIMEKQKPMQQENPKPEQNTKNEKAINFFKNLI